MCYRRRCHILRARANRKLTALRQQPPVSRDGRLPEQRTTHPLPRDTNRRHVSTYERSTHLVLLLKTPLANRAPRLPPLQAGDLSPDPYYPSSAYSHMSPSVGPGARSPQSGSLPSQVPGRGPVPKFQQIKSVQELHPRVHTQPAYRRANPEGGFISVSAFMIPILLSSLLTPPFPSPFKR